MKRTDWIKLRCGDRVSLSADPRHTGRIESIVHGEIKVCWEGTGWFSHHSILEMEDLEFAPTGE